MAAAVVQAQFGNGGSVAWANAETGIKFNADDTQVGTTAPIQVPTATGTNFSWLKHLALFVTTTGTTNMSNRRVSLSVAEATGLSLWWRTLAVGSYVQSTGTLGAAEGNRPAATGTNTGPPVGATTFTRATTSLVVYDASSIATSSSAVNGLMCIMCLGVDNLYVGGAGNAIALPNIILTYDEA